MIWLVNTKPQKRQCIPDFRPEERTIEPMCLSKKISFMYHRPLIYDAKITTNRDYGCLLIVSYSIEYRFS